MTISSLLEGLKSTQQQISINKHQHPSISADLERIQQNNNLLGTNTNTSSKTAAIRPICGIDKSINTSMSILTNEENYEYVKCLIDKHPSIKCGHCKEQQYPEKPLSCKQMGSPPSHGSISFSNIKLDCMCSYEGSGGPGEGGEVDRYDRYHRQIKYHRDGEDVENSPMSKIRYLSSSSLVNSPPGHHHQQHHQHHHQQCNKSNEYIKQICDNCKKSSLPSSSLSKNLGCTRGVEGSSTTGISSTTTANRNNSNSYSSDNIVTEIGSTLGQHQKKKTKSTDNITAVLPADGAEGEIDEETNSSSNSQILTRENSKKSNKRSDKLLLDLNDKSKYTKEVSV